MPNTRERWRNFGDVLIPPVKCSILSSASSTHKNKARIEKWESPLIQTLKLKT
jgi:hypothetical protein